MVLGWDAWLQIYRESEKQWDKSTRNVLYICTIKYKTTNNFIYELTESWKQIMTIKTKKFQGLANAV